MRRLSRVFRLVVPCAVLFLLSPVVHSQDASIRLIIRGDDMGFSHSANLAAIKAYKDGIMRSVEVIVPGPWFPEAGRMLRENPGLDAGVHLDLTSEWQNLKWGPLTHVPSISTSEGKFYATIWPDKDLPPHSDLRSVAWDLADVEKELRAQIELAKKELPNLTHLSEHMGCLNDDPRLRSLGKRLAQEYGLPLELEGARDLPAFNPSDNNYAAKQGTMIAALEKMGPGLWLVIEHPALDSPEMRAVGNGHDWNIAQEREDITRLLTDERVKQVIARRHIQLISYGDYYRKQR